MGVAVVLSGFAVGQDADAPLGAIDTDWGSRVLEFDFPAIKVGIAEYPDGPTGATVLHFPDGAAMAMDVRGGSPGVVGEYGYVHAISLAGGSLFGLEAAAGVTAGLLERQETAARWDTIPLVSGGIVFDFGGRDNNVYPDKRLGGAALANTKVGRFPLGARGAGIAVTVGNGFAFDRGEQAGQGAAFREVGGIKIFACTVVNAIGAVFDRNGNVVLGHLDPETGKRTTFAEDLERRLAALRAPNADRSSRVSSAGVRTRSVELPAVRLDRVAPATRLASVRESAGQNTTLTVVVTNQTVRGHDLEQLGRQVHSSMARAIQPFHTRDDGDVLWMVSTAEVDVPEWSLTALGVAASEVVWDAVLEAHP